MNAWMRTTAPLIVATVLLAAACSSQREPARQALASVDSSIDAAQPDAGRYVPERLAALQARVAPLRQAFDRGDYKSVLDGAPALLDEAQGLPGVAGRAREQAQAQLRLQWPAYANSLPQWLEGMQKRADHLETVRHKLVGIELAAARAQLAEARRLWGLALSAFAAGNLEEALATAASARERAAAAAAALKMPAPA